jgi:BirA family biotin operon repressor/biotin-[acetyl-CoA-carboxylase] ligase
MHKSDRLHLEDIAETIERSTLWEQIVYLEQVGSTNDVAKELASQGAPAGTVVVAEEQTAGRGRLDRRWVAPRHTSLLCSVLLRPDLRPAQGHRLTMLFSMAAADAVAAMVDLSVALKWPNDLIAGPQTRGGEVPGGRTYPTWRKLAGILTESGVIDGDLAFAVVGIGINVNVPRDVLPDLAPNATSILAETGRRMDRTALLVNLLQAIEARFERLRGGENPHREWASRLTTLGRRVRATTAEGFLHGVAEGVDQDGALLLRLEDGSRRRLLAGDVTLARD